jgi:hypothetical protein
MFLAHRTWIPLVPAIVYVAMRRPGMTRAALARCGAFAHGMVSLEIDGRFPPDAEIDGNDGGGAGARISVASWPGLNGIRSTSQR